MKTFLKSTAATALWLGATSSGAYAAQFDVPGGDLATALNAYSAQSGVQLVVLTDQVRGVTTRGAHGELSASVALSRILTGTGFVSARDSSGGVMIVRARKEKTSEGRTPVTRVADAIAPEHAAAGVETVVVTSSKIKGDIQTIPIAITALSQEQLTTRQIAGGPDLVKEVPNLTFSKTNFTGYNIQIRGIGTQAISVTTDPAVAVAFNDTPFLRNHFFEQEFFDVAQVEVVRGPQGTLYGRNATAGVVNVISAKPTDHFEAMLSADWGNYSNRRYEGMVNLPIVGDKLMLRIAGEWTKRDGYTYNSLTHAQEDGRDLWSGRVTLRWQPTDKITADAIWEHFQENDDRERSAKQLCKTDPGLTNVDGLDITTLTGGTPPDRNAIFAQAWLSQGCLPTSFYSNDAFGVPNGQVIPFVALGEFIWGVGDGPNGTILNRINPYASTVQSHDLRTIESLIPARYRARNDTLELNVDYRITPSLTLTSQTGWNKDFLWSTQDFNRFDTAPGIFSQGLRGTGGNESPVVDGVYCDPQLGCSDRMVAQDLSREHAWQLSQEVRLASDFKGPLNFSVGANYLHYQTNEDFFVFFNVLSAITQVGNGGGPGDYTHCNTGTRNFVIPDVPYFNSFYGTYGGMSSVFFCGNGALAESVNQSTYIDPNPIPSINGDGHNYFRSENPYAVSSYAGFGEVYYQLTPDLKLTGGLRWTDDQKTFWEIPSWTYLTGGGYPVVDVVNQEWKEFTGRGVVTWTPKLDFTDQTMIYASYSRGYKGGGANPPVPEANYQSAASSSVHPPTFAPEFVNAYELGTKNTLLDGAMTFNGDVFYYDYKGYQISKIVDRTSINDNFDAHIYGAELQADYSPLPGLRFSFAGGYEHTRVNDGQSSIDVMDRTAGNLGWVVVKPFISDTSNCVLPDYAVRAILEHNSNPSIFGFGLAGACDAAYHPGGMISVLGGNRVTLGYMTGAGFDPRAGNDYPYVPGTNMHNGIDYGPASNNGEGFAKPLGGNELPNAPHFTVSLGADYTIPVSPNWAATLHTDFYWQSQSWARIYNDRPYDKLRGYSNVNLALILNDATGWQVMGYVKNIFDTTAITGAFLLSDDTALTTNIFTTDPRLYGVRVTKNFEAGDGGFDLFSTKDGKPPLLWITLDGQYAMQKDDLEIYNPAFLASSQFDAISRVGHETAPKTLWNRGAEISFQPEDSNWIFSGSIRYGKIGRKERDLQITPSGHVVVHNANFGDQIVYRAYQDFQTQSTESHTIMDFAVGRDVGLGRFGNDPTSIVSAGVRVAQFDSTNSVEIKSQPTNCAWGDRNPACPYNKFDGFMEAERKFHGIGPSLSWKASSMVMGDRSDGGISVDWGVNGAVLFGRQKVTDQHQTSEHYFNGQAHIDSAPVYQYASSPSRSKRITVPNLGGYVGASVRYNNAKISAGYRADFFFNAIDGGIDVAKKENRGFYGPYLNLSIGFGG